MNQGQPMQSAPVSSGDSQHKAFAIIGYIVPILFFIPMLSDEGKQSQFAMFHANQQLVLLIGWVIASFLTFLIIGLLLYIPLFIFMIMGLISAAGGTMKKLPLVGGITILK